MFLSITLLLKISLYSCIVLCGIYTFSEHCVCLPGLRSVLSSAGHSHLQTKLELPGGSEQQTQAVSQGETHTSVAKSHCVEKLINPVFLSYAPQKLFRNAMLFHFINVLLQVLLHKSHDLLQDDITLALYNMAAVDFQAFYSSFLPEFLNGCQGLDPHQRTTLARNFRPERVWF